jgi:hypothetical protein
VVKHGALSNLAIHLGASLSTAINIDIVLVFGALVVEQDGLHTGVHIAYPSHHNFIHYNFVVNVAHLLRFELIFAVTLVNPQTAYGILDAFFLALGHLLAHT